jgi:protein gp37
MVRSRMFPFITDTWNPLGGKCDHDCIYCWAQGPKGLVNKYDMKKYCGSPYVVEKELRKTFKEGEFIFVCDMCDLFGDWVPSEFIERILDVIRASPATFLLLTKHPARYHEFDIPHNCVCGATVESDVVYEDVTKAPFPCNRLLALKALDHPRKMISIEPIMWFNLDLFVEAILDIMPEFVAVGYDNYNHNLREPSLAKTRNLIQILEMKGIKVYLKTIREAKPVIER